MVQEKELYKCKGRNVKVKLKDGHVKQGFCSMFTKAIDNEPEEASICLEINGELIELMQNEISELIALE